MSRVGVLLPRSGLAVKQFLQIKQVLHAIFETVDYFSINPNLDYKVDVLPLITIDCLKYDGLIIPDGIGWYSEIDIMYYKVLNEFKTRPILIIGTGCGILQNTLPSKGDEWMFNQFSIASPTIYDEQELGIIDKMMSSELITMNGGQHCSSLKNQFFIAGY